MLGSRLGSKRGFKGSVVGSSADDEGGGSVAPAWTVDSLSSIAVPASSSEWSAFIAAKSLAVAVPDALWLLQDASGNPVDVIGGFTLTASGTPVYQQAETGWSRKGVLFADGANTRLTNTSASLPDISTASITTLLMANVSVSGNSTRAILSHGANATPNKIRVTNTPRMALVSVATVATGTQDPTGVVRPYVLRTNHTSGLCGSFTNAEKLAEANDATIAGQQIVIGNPGGFCPTFNALYAVQWHNANAEMSDATIKALIQALGFTTTGI